MCSSDLLDHIQISLGFDVIVVSNAPLTECLIVVMDNADSTASEPFHRIFLEEVEERIAQRACQKRLIIPLVSLR